MVPGESELRDALSRLAGLRLLVLHGSRSRGEGHERSDWDFAYRADADLDPGELHAILVHALGTDRVDLSDLERAGAVLRYRVAADGRAVYERSEGEFDDFRYEAILFWLDAGHVIRAENEAILKRLG
jgi:predicted nucleotidyltransferase